MSYLVNGKGNNVQYPISSSNENNMISSEPNSMEKLNWLIHLQHVRGETVACKELIKAEIAKSGGRNEYAFFKQGMILREEGKIQEALESFQTCLKLNPDNADNIKETAKCLYEMSRFRLALEAYLEAEKLCKIPDWQIYYNIGQCLMRLGETSKAKSYAQRSVQLGKHEVSYALLIKILITEGDLKSAATVCNSAVESCPDSVNLLTESGLIYLKLGQSQNAFERLSSALALNSSCAKALLGIGCITQSHEEHDVALTKYKIAVVYEPDSVALWNNIGLCFYSKQKYVAAISCLKRALWISPMNWRVLYNLGLVHLATSQAASAFNFLCASVNLRPDIAQSFTVLGYSLMELKDLENSLRAQRQALLLAPIDPIIIVNTALSFAFTGQRDQALEVLKRFQELQGQKVHITKETRNLAEVLITFLSTSNENSENASTENVIEKSLNSALSKSDSTNAGRVKTEEIIHREDLSRNITQIDLDEDEV